MAERTLTPRLIVPDSAKAIDFYCHVFGAEEIERFTSPEGLIVHAAVAIDGAVVALADEAPDWNNQSPDQLGGSPVILTLMRDDPDATMAAAVELGAEVIFPVADQFYGQREGRMADPFGHLWILCKITRKMTAAEIQQGVDNFAAPQH